MSEPHGSGAGVASPPAPEPLLQVQDLRVSFRSRRGTAVAVDGLSFSVAPGEVLGVVGESGSGKSVSMMSLLGLIRDPNCTVAGTARFRGRDLVAMDSRRRLFSGLLRRMLVLRDDVCVTPWCEAPVVHADHAHPAKDGGGTGFANGSGQCARCNLAKEAAGWSVRVVHPGLDPGVGESDRWHPREVEVVTPTGHAYRAIAPPLTGWGAEHPASASMPQPSIGQRCDPPALSVSTSPERPSQRAPDRARAAPPGEPPASALERHLVSLLHAA